LYAREKKLIKRGDKKTMTTPAPKPKTGKDWYAEFRGKQRLTEQEVKLIQKRLNRGSISPHHLRDGGYALTPDQVRKGYKWLMNQWKTPSGAERKDNPFGYREQDILENFKSMRILQFYDAGNRYSSFYVPLYSVHSKKGNYFEYYVSGGEVNIVG
jgi:hypothetical protein